MSALLVDITGLDKAVVLAALYNAAAPHGKGFLVYDPTPMTVEQARAILAHRDPADQMMVQAKMMGILPEYQEWANHCFYYLHGRVLHVCIFDDALDPEHYDTKHGLNAAQHAITTLCETGDVNALAIWQAHLERTVRQAWTVWGFLHRERREKILHGMRIVTLGFADHAERLRTILAPILYPLGN